MSRVLSANRARGRSFRSLPLPPLLPFPLNVVEGLLPLEGSELTHGRPEQSPHLLLLLHLLLLSLPPLLLLFLLLQGAVQEEGQSCGVESFVGCEQRGGQRRSSQRGAAHSAVAPLRPGHLRQRYRPHPPRQGRRCPWARVRLEPCLSRASSLLLSPWGVVRLHLIRAVVELLRESQQHRHTHMPLPCTWAALRRSAAPLLRSPSLATAEFGNKHVRYGRHWCATVLNPTPVWWLWWLWWLWCGRDVTMVCFSVPLHGCTKLGWQNTWESDSRRPRHPGPQRPDGRSPKNAAKLQKTTPHRHQEADHAQLQLCVPVVTEMSTDSGDELNQWHFDCRETTCRCILQRRVHNRRNCDCGTSTNFCRAWTMRGCRSKQRAEQARPAQQGSDHQETYYNCGVSMVFQTGKTMGICLCGTKGKPTTIDEMQLRDNHGLLHHRTTHLVS